MSELSDPQRMGRILHQAMEEVLGGDGLRAVLLAAQLPDPDAVGSEFVDEASGHFSRSKLHQVLTALGQEYGSEAGRGLALRIGRACFQYALREYGDALGLTANAFRLLPFPAKLDKFAGSLAGLFNSPADQLVRIEKQAGKLLWTMEQCPFCGQTHSDEAHCLLPVGLAEEALYWLSGGKMFSVEEVACIARGDAACVVQVDASSPLS